MPNLWFEVQSDRSLIPLNVVGELRGDGTTDPLQVSRVPDIVPPSTPLSPSITDVTLDSRTQATITWTAPNNSGRPPITAYYIYRDDDGGALAYIDTVDDLDRTFVDTPLPTNSPEIVFGYVVKAVNADGVGEASNRAVVQWGGTPISAPTAPTNLIASQLTSTQVRLTWAETVDATVTKHGLFKGNTLTVDNLDATAVTYLWTGLTPGVQQSNVNIRRFNSAGWSPASNSVAFTPPVVPLTVDPWTGCSGSTYDHGGTQVWDGWRVYTQSRLNQVTNLTNGYTTTPLFVCYSKDGPNLGYANPTYQAVFNEALADLNAFYYTSATGQTQSNRWGIKLYWSNGNENYNKGALGNGKVANHSAGNIALYVESQRGLYDAVHYIDPTTGQRRFPDAYAGSNPTQYAESKGEVAPWLHPSARYHDFVVWSMYPPGRNTTVTDPTFDWPSFDPADRNTNLGFLVRCFYRTQQAQDVARAATGNQNFSLSIACGEIGIADDPGDSTTRPYYAVHGLMDGIVTLAEQYNFDLPFVCWWDGWVDQSVSNVDSRLTEGEPANTSPSTRVAWQNWRSYNHRRGGTHPASWAGNPKSNWKTRGTVY